MRKTAVTLLERTLLTSTGKSSVVTFLSMVASTGFAAAYFIILARVLGPYGNGLFSVALAAMMMITGIVDFGTNYGIIHFVPKAQGEGDGRRMRGYLKLGLLSKVILGLAGTVVVALAANQISLVFLKRPEVTPLLLISSFGIFSGLLYGYGLALPQALQRFVVWGVLLFGSGFFRIVTLFILIAFGWLSPETAMIAYLVMLLFPFIGSLFFWPKGLLVEPIKKEYWGYFFSFNRWMALYTVVVSMAGSLPQFFLARFSGLSEVGYFVTASQIAGVGLNVNAALATVLIPKFAAMKTLEALRRFLKKSILLTSGLAMGGIFVSLFSGILMQLLFGMQYLPGILPLRILIVSVACVLAFLPFTCVWLYYQGDSRSFAIYYVINGIVLFGVNLLLVPKYGAAGSAVASLIGNTMTLIVAIGYTLIVFKKIARAPAESREMIEPMATEPGR